MTDKNKSELIKCTILLISSIIGFLFCWKFGAIPLSESEFEECEQIAYNAYYSSGIIVEAPDGFNVNISTTTIEVSLSSSLQWRCGKVIARLKHGELVYFRNYETDKRIAISTMIGSLALLVTYCLQRYFIK